MRVHVRSQARRLKNDLVAGHFRGRPVTVLEAGGGSHSKIDLPALAISGITTLDISPEALAMNSYADEKILGDLQDWTPARTWDLVVIFNVLEHIPRADLAMEILARACAPDGLVVIGGPVARSFSGLVTSLTPHRFHVFFYRHVLGKAEAGKPGHAPFPTHFHPMSQLDRLETFLAEQGLECVFRAEYEGGLNNALTPKRYDTRRGDFCAIFRKPAAERGSAALDRQSREQPV